MLFLSTELMTHLLTAVIALLHLLFSPLWPLCRLHSHRTATQIKTFLSRFFPYRFSSDSHCSHMLDSEFCQVREDVQQVTDPPKQKCSARRLKVKRSHSSWLLMWDVTCDMTLVLKHCRALTAVQAQVLHVPLAVKCCGSFLSCPSLLV